MIFTGLLASTQGPSWCNANSTCEAKDLASWVSFTDGRACRPTALVSRAEATRAELGMACSFMTPLLCRQLFGRALDDLEGRAARSFGGSHDGSLHDRCVAHHHVGPASLVEHLDGHLAVGLGTAEIDQDRHSRARPCPFD